jgi:hypothetical protein
MSKEVKKILSNPDDAKKYRESLDILQIENKKEVTIEFSNNRKLTIVQNKWWN